MSARVIRSKLSPTVTVREPPKAAATLGISISAGIAKPSRTSALAVAARRRVDGQHDRLEARRHRLLHQRPGHPGIAERIELEPTPAAGRRGGDLARPRRGQRRETHDGAERGGGARHRHLTLGVEQPLVGDRADENRRRHRTAQHLRRGRGDLDPGQLPRPQPPARPSRHVLAQRHLVPGAAGEMATRPGPERALGLGLRVVDVDPALKHGGEASAQPAWRGCRCAGGTRKWSTAGREPTPFRAFARTSRRCLPGARPRSVSGEAQWWKAFASTLQR